MNMLFKVFQNSPDESDRMEKIACWQYYDCFSFL